MRLLTTYLVQLNNIRVSDFLEDVDLASHSLNVTLVLNAVFLKNLNCYFFT